METFEVELVKDQQGLGITIAGYVCEKGAADMSVSFSLVFSLWLSEEISGIFIKSIAAGSVADLSKQIAINDQIIEVSKRKARCALHAGHLQVDGRSLYGYTNHQAVEVLRNTGKMVKLRLARYLRGSKYEQLQQAIASPDPPSPHLSHTIPGSTIIQVYDQSSDGPQNKDRQTLGLSFDDLIPSEQQSEEEIIKMWKMIVGDSFDIVVRLISVKLSPNNSLIVPVYPLGCKHCQIQRRRWSGY